MTEPIKEHEELPSDIEDAVTLLKEFFADNEHSVNQEIISALLIELNDQRKYRSNEIANKCESFAREAALINQYEAMITLNEQV